MTEKADGPLFLHKLPLRAAELVTIARRRNISVRDVDEGYLVHALLTELWQADAPRPFLLAGASLEEGRRSAVIDVWGYSRVPKAAMVEHAASFGDPGVIAVIDGGLEAIASKSMPRFEAGRLVGFRLRACPIVRTKSSREPDKSRELDAWLAACLRNPNQPVSREAVYAEWLAARLGGRGVEVVRSSLVGFQRDRLVRRTQGEERVARRLERPDARFEGILRVTDPEAFEMLLVRGIGRHRAFGFGMLLLVPPGR